MRKNSILVVIGSLVALIAIAPQCSSGTTDCTQTDTCPGDASDGPPPLSCDMTKDPKDAPGCVDDRVGVFVATTGSDTNPGTKAAPYQTIGKALTSAGALTRVYVCEGTYAEDVLLQPPVDGISIYGGFKCADWSYSGNKVQIGKGTIALTIASTTKPIAIEDLLVQSAAGGGTTPNSIAALVANTTGAVTFTRVNLTAGAGVDGIAGGAGSNYSGTLAQSDPTIAGHDASGNAGGTLQSCSSLCSDAVASTGGQGGAGGGAPSGGSGGAPALGGGAAGVVGSCGGGGTGGDGNNATTPGADATSPSVLGTLSATGWTSTTSAGGKNGGVAQGGGGGTGASSGGGGGGGCGGCGGGGGLGGGGGGASVALAVFTSNVTMNASALTTSSGGNGGVGGTGQVGQMGGFSGNKAGNGCGGGNGGNGSVGGTGAGGVGGVSVGVLYKGNAPTLDSTTTAAITTGKAGSKGLGGKTPANDGIDGVAAPTLQSP